MTKQLRLETKGDIPLKGDSYKLLMGNCFTVSEIGMMLTACGVMFKNYIREAEGGDKHKLEINTMSACIGKLLLALPEQHRMSILNVYKKNLNIDFSIQEVQTPEKEEMQ